MSSRREEKIASLLKKLVSDFLARLELNKSIVTITSIELSKDLKFAKVFVSIYPEKEDEKILDIIKSGKSGIKKYIRSKTRLKFLPDLEFNIDKGERNRQKIEELLSKN
jgi:ribosome-binding factor A